MATLAVNKNGVLHYKGSRCLRQRLILSTLSGKSVRISDIRTSQDEPGLKEYEVSLIRLLDKITNGTVITINETGTVLFYQPGLITGGKIEHECNMQRSIGYYLEAALMIGLFSKNPLHLTLHGITNSVEDPSVDHVKAAALPIMRKFIYDDEGLSLKVVKRGMPPQGGGQIVFQCPAKKQLKSIQLSEPGMIKRIRGTAYALRVSPATANRIVDSAKGVLLKFIPDVYITTDQSKGKQSGKSPGFGVNLVAETNADVFYCSEQTSNAMFAADADQTTPEDIGRMAANRLLQEIYCSGCGCVDSAFQSLCLLFMALGPKDVSSFVMGAFSEYTISFLQHLREFFGIVFKIERVLGDDDDGEKSEDVDKISMTCVGIGYTNLNKRVL